jgi:glycosyltransferase involved in cell wall biosynthesis
MINLHVMHSWGGGLEKWVRDYTDGSQDRDTNFVLKSIGEHGVPARSIYLYRNVEDLQPLRSWNLDKPIVAIAPTHLEYRYILQEIIDVFQIENIIVSSFIGHSLELLQTSVRTIAICHDFYPFCPVINAYFKGNCQECNFSHLKTCFAENNTRYFPLTSAIEWMEIRQVYVDSLINRQIPLIAPSPFIKDRSIALEPKLANVPMFVVPHGVPPLGKIDLTEVAVSQTRLRIAILGEMLPHKGLALLEQICAPLGEIADLYLLGCGDSGYLFKRHAHVTLVPSYRREELPKLFNELGIDLGLLLSIWTETFSYTLSELLMMGVPTLATNLGSFADRLQDGVNGFLVDPIPELVLAKLKFILANRELLVAVRDRLRDFEHKDTVQMTLDYQYILEQQLLDRHDLDLASEHVENATEIDLLKLQLKLYHQELSELKSSQIRIQHQLERQEFYPNWQKLKKRYEPISRRFKVFKHFKRAFPNFWLRMRDIALYFKVLP